MSRRWLIAIAAAAACSGALSPFPLPSPRKKKKANDKDMKKRTEDAIERGLEWLKKTQAQDGHWEAQGGQYPTTMTAPCGHVLPHGGQHPPRGQVLRAHPEGRQLVPHTAPPAANGLLGNVNNPTESARYMYGHGFGTCSSPASTARRKTRTTARSWRSPHAGRRVHRPRSDEQEAPQARGKEVDAAAGATSPRADGGNFDEGSVTITQVQALRAPATPASSCPRRSSRRPPTT